MSDSSLRLSLTSGARLRSAPHNASNVVPIEVALHTRNTDLSALESIIRGYLSKNVASMWPSTARGTYALKSICSDTINTDTTPLSTEQIEIPAPHASINRASLLIPILPSMSKQFQHIRSLRLGDYGRAITSVEEYVRCQAAKILSQQQKKPDQDELSECTGMSHMMKLQGQWQVDGHCRSQENHNISAASAFTAKLGLSTEEEEDFYFFLSCNIFTDRHTAATASETTEVIDSYMAAFKYLLSLHHLNLHQSQSARSVSVESSSSAAKGGPRNRTTTTDVAPPILPLSYTSRNLYLSYEALFFQLHDDSTTTCLVGKNNNNNGPTDSSAASATPSINVMRLPHESLEGLWESLLYGNTVEDSQFFKQELLRYIQTSLVFGAAQVNARLIQWNRLMLFYGPPGTGKTSICKALAQKLSIVLQRAFATCSLIELQAPHVFSRFFSESGKQVMEIFNRIHTLAEDPQHLVIVIMDEVESLVARRESSIQGNDPSDAVRVVNNILNQIDALEKHSNILILCTSNMMDFMDRAFVDRVDKKVFVGPPGSSARRFIIRSSFAELIHKQLIRKPQFLMSAADADATPNKEENKDVSIPPIQHAVACSKLLSAIVTLSDGLSGRFLRKIPFLTFARASEELGLSNIFSRVNRNLTESDDKIGSLKDHQLHQVSMIHFLKCMLYLVQREVEDHLPNPSSNNKRLRHEENEDLGNNKTWESSS